MYLIPVIDLLDGQIVHAIAGQREHYAPFEKSRFEFESASDLGQQWIDEFSPRCLYVADLNAIQGNGNNLDQLAELLKLRIHLLIDVGISNTTDLIEWTSLLDHCRESQPGSPRRWSPVIGTESIQTLCEFDQLLLAVDDQAFVSIDIQNRKILGSAFEKETLDSLLDQISNQGINNVILLDLDAVGTGKSSARQLSSALTNKALNMNIFLGGGIRDQLDLESCLSMGYSGALVSTAIHSGQIRVN